MKRDGTLNANEAKAAREQAARDHETRKRWRKAARAQETRRNCDETPIRQSESAR